MRTRDRGYTRVERKIGRFIRRFKLPDNIDADNISAKVRIHSCLLLTTVSSPRHAPDAQISMLLKPEDICVPTTHMSARSAACHIADGVAPRCPASDDPGCCVLTWRGLVLLESLHFDTLQVNNGVLEVHIPKTGQPERNQRTIDVQ